MLHTLILPDGQVIGSGVGEPAVKAVQLTHDLGDAVPGAVSAAGLELTLYGQPALNPGDRLELRDEDGTVGVFFLRSVTDPAPGQRKLEAYDAVAFLDAPADGFLENASFPMALGDLARGLADHFGLELTGTLLNADLEVPAFAYRGITGRQLMAWICQAGGRFCVADGDGLALRWYEEGTLPGFVYQNSLEKASYTVPAPGQVVIAQTASDVGVCYPEEGDDPLRIQGNPLLTQPGDAAQVLFEALSGFSFTPCTLTTDKPIPVGTVFAVDGKTCVAASVERSGGRVRISAKGSATGAATVKGAYRALAGRVLELQLELQGVVSRLAEFGEDATLLSQLTQNVDRITAQVAVLSVGEEALGKSLEELTQSSRQEFTELSLRSDALELEVGSMAEAVEGKADAAELRSLSEHFRFDEAGLTISDSNTGMGIGISEEQVVFTGGDPTTRITPTGMTTTDITVENRLRLGDFVLLPRQNGNLSLRWQGENR